MTITEYLASADYYLDPELDELGDIMATKGNICVRNDQNEPVIHSDGKGGILSVATFQNDKAPTFIAYLRALELQA